MNPAELRRTIAGCVPDFYWFRDSHHVNEQGITIVGSGFCRDGIPAAGLWGRIAEQLTQIQTSAPGPRAAKTFWYLPPECTFDVSFSTSNRSVSSPILASLSSSALPDTAPACTFAQYSNWSSLKPAPPRENIERVSGKGATEYNYFNNGYTDFWRFSTIASSHGVDVANSDTQILDWGCGCGRLTRHFLQLPNGGRRVLGVDIDPNNIQWCRTALSQDSFATVDLFPPTRLQDNKFDVIIGNSVLSHLDRTTMDAWLKEIARLLKPGAIALLSYHGDFSIAGFCSQSPSLVESILATGFNADTRATELDDVIGNTNYYRQTFMTDNIASSIFGTHFRIEQTIVGVVSRFQNVAVLSKR